MNNGSTGPQSALLSLRSTIDHSTHRQFLIVIWLMAMLLFWTAQIARAQAPPCPTITNTGITAITVCSGEPVHGLSVNTTATYPPYQIEFARFNRPQANPYNPYAGDTPITVGELPPVNGKAVLPAAEFPPNTGSTDAIYYVYACLKLSPVDTSCHPTALIVVTVKPKPTATATGGTITCTNLGTFHLSGSSSVPNSTYTWSGPGITAANKNLQNPGVSLVGTYTLVVTANGCASAPVTTVVTQAVSPPVASVNSLTLTCAQPTGVLTATATNASSLSYAWSTGAITPTISVSSAGPYSVTVTNENGCSSVASTNVTSIKTTPSVSAAGGTITCSTGSVTLVSTVSPAGTYDYFWTGPGSYSSNETNPVVGMAGTYTLTVTNASGCAASATAEAAKDNNLPGASAVGGTITCAQTTVQLKGSTSSTAAVIYLWSGPGITSANETQQTPTVSVPGVYTLLVTRIGSSCLSMAEAIVDVDTGKPGVSISTLPGCLGQTLTLTGSSTVVNAQYAWTGPAGFTASTAVATVPMATTANAGSYSLTVTNPETGCQSSTTVTAVFNAAPQDFSLVAKEATCLGPNSKTDGQVTIVGFTTGSTYEVSTGAAFTGTGTAIPTDGVVVSNVGRLGTAQTYQVRVYNATGCFVLHTVTLQNKICECPVAICVPITIQRTKVAVK